MADPPSSPATLDLNSQRPETDNLTLPSAQPDPPPASVPTPPQQQQQSAPPLPNPNTNLTLVSQPPSTASSYPPGPPQLPGAAAAAGVPPVGPSFRLVPQFSPLPNYPNPSVVVQPPGVSAGGPGVVVGGVAGAPLPPPPMMAYQVPPGAAANPALRPYATLPNGYPVIPTAAPQGTIPLPVS